MDSSVRESVGACRSVREPLSVRRVRHGTPTCGSVCERAGVYGSVRERTGAFGSVGERAGACGSAQDSGSRFSYRFVRWRDLSAPPAGKWHPKATSNIDVYVGGISLGHLLGNGLRKPLLVQIICWRDLPRCVRWRDLPGPPAGKWPPEATSRTDYMLAGPPSATCWDTASGGHFSYRFVRWRDLPGPLAGKWPPEATSSIDVYAGETVLGHLLGNGVRRPLLV